MIVGDSLGDVFAKVKGLKEKYAERDRNARNVKLVRRGKFDVLSPDMFSDDWPAPIVANLVDNFCRDFAATVAPLPAFNCSSGSMLTDKAKRQAEARTRIVNHYVEFSNLAAQMLEAGDSYAAYGLMAFSVEPDTEEHNPRIRVLDGATVYPVWDRNMRTTSAAHSTWLDKASLVAMYPEAADALRKASAASMVGNRVEVVKYVDKTRCVTYLPECGNHVLQSYPNLLGRCFIVAVPRPSSGNAFGGDIKGAYDDLVWPQLARHRFQLLALEGAEKTIRSPLVVPPDVTDVPMGDDAVIHTSNPQGVQKVQFNLPVGAFQAMESLQQEMDRGAMSPQSRSGSIDASVITGRGVQQLMEGYSTQIAAAQEMSKFALRQCIKLCFEWDERLWPDLKKTVRGTDQGAPFEITYMPKTAIAGDHTVHIEYGFLAGLDANRALVYVLQARGDQLVSREFARRQLPANLNVVEEERKIQVELMNDSLLQSMSGLAQSIPQLVVNGADPSAIVAKIAEVNRALRKGKDIDEVVAEVFAPPPPAPEAQAPLAPGQPPAPAQPGQPGPTGGPQIPTGPDGRPDLQMLFAGLTGSGNANLQAGVQRMIPAG